MSRSQEMLVRAATLYYLDGMSQAQVAEAIGVSRPNVSRVLAEARRSGVIEIAITITDSVGRAAELEHALKRNFDIHDARVARGPDPELTRIGRLGADWLVTEAPAEGTVSLAWGSTIQAVVRAVDVETPLPNLEILPLAGGLSIVESEQDCNVLVRELAHRFGARDRRLNAPAVVASPELREAFLREPSIRAVLSDAARADIALVGVGAVGSGSSAAIVEHAAFDPSDAAAFAASGAVGDCCFRYFDAQGSPVVSPLDERVVAVKLDDLRDVGVVEAMAAGSAKAAAVRAALAGGFVDVLVVDEPLARALLPQPGR
ncbi:MAG: sugar-binding transcriptional regulator [Arachnia sp.]